MKKINIIIVMMLLLSLKAFTQPYINYEIKYDTTQIIGIDSTSLRDQSKVIKYKADIFRFNLRTNKEELFRSANDIGDINMGLAKRENDNIPWLLYIADTIGVMNCNNPNEKIELIPYSDYGTYQCAMIIEPCKVLYLNKKKIIIIFYYVYFRGDSWNSVFCYDLENKKVINEEILDTNIINNAWMGGIFASKDEGKIYYSAQKIINNDTINIEYEYDIVKKQHNYSFPLNSIGIKSNYDWQQYCRDDKLVIEYTKTKNWRDEKSRIYVVYDMATRKEYPYIEESEESKPFLDSTGKYLILVQTTKIKVIDYANQKVIKVINVPKGDNVYYDNNILYYYYEKEQKTLKINKTELISGEQNPPKVVNINGCKVKQGEVNRITIKVTDQSKITMSKIRYLINGAIKEQQMVLESQKDSIYNYTVTLPAHKEATVGAVRFILADEYGNTDTTQSQQISWKGILPIYNIYEKQVEQGTVKIAYSNKNLYMLSNNNGKSKITKTNWFTGIAESGELNLTGTEQITEIETDSKETIIGCNKTENSGNQAFKVYVWEEETQPSKAVIEYKGGKYGLGDKLSIKGSIKDKTAEIYAQVSKSIKILKWKQQKDGSFKKEPEVIMGILLKSVKDSTSAVKGELKAIETENKYIGIVQKKEGLELVISSNEEVSKVKKEESVGMLSVENIITQPEFAYKQEGNGNYIVYVLNPNKSINSYWIRIINKELKEIPNF